MNLETVERYDKILLVVITFLSPEILSPSWVIQDFLCAYKGYNLSQGVFQYRSTLGPYNLINLCPRDVYCEPILFQCYVIPPDISVTDTGKSFQYPCMSLDVPSAGTLFPPSQTSMRRMSVPYGSCRPLVVFDSSSKMDFRRVSLVSMSVEEKLKDRSTYHFFI